MADDGLSEFIEMFRSDGKQFIKCRVTYVLRLPDFRALVYTDILAIIRSLLYADILARGGAVQSLEIDASVQGLR